MKEKLAKVQFDQRESLHAAKELEQINKVSLGEKSAAKVAAAPVKHHLQLQ